MLSIAFSRDARYGLPEIHCPHGAGENNAIREIPFKDAFSFLLQQTHRPGDPEKMKKTLALLSQMNGKVRFYKFVFNNLKDDCFAVAYGAMTKGQP